MSSLSLCSFAVFALCIAFQPRRDDCFRAAGDDPTEYVDVAYKVPERKYNAWPESIRLAFAPARMVRTGKPSFTLTLKPDG